MSNTKIKSSNIDALAVTHDKLHTSMDLTGKTVTVATPTASTHPTTKTYVDTLVNGLIDGAPDTLNTLNELAAALGDDASLSSTLATSIAAKLPLAGGTMTGALNMGANNITTTGKMLFSNLYAAVGDLPSASTYHGMFAHVHATGKAYYAHAGNWVELANSGAAGGGYGDSDTAAYLATSQNKTINTAGGNVGIGIATAAVQTEIQTTTNIGKDEVRGLLRLTGQAIAENSGTTPSAGAGIQFYNRWSGGAAYSMGRISARGESGYNGGLHFDVSTNSAAGQSGFTNAMSIKANGNVLVAAGNVGIGTTSPSAPLDVVTNTNVYAAEFTQSNTSNGDGVSIVVGSTAAADYALTVRSNAGNTSVLAAKADGKVGIGVFSPTSPLHIEGADFSSGTAYIKQTVATNTPTLFIEQVGQGGNGGTNQGLLIKVDGQNAGAGNIIRAIGTNSNLNGGADIEALTVQNSGKVGIGTASPGAYLHVFKAGSANDGMVPLIKVQTDTNNTTGDGSGIEFHGKYLGGEWGFGKIGGANSGANYGGALEFHTNSGNGSGVSTAFTKKMAIDHLGNLDLVTDGANLKIYYNAAGLYSANLGWRHLQLGNNGANYLVAGATATGGDLTFVVNNTTDLSTNNGSSHNGTVAMHIDSTGKVGLGTETPGGNLQIGNNWTVDASYGTGHLYIKDATASTIATAPGDPRVTSTSVLPAIITTTSTNTGGPDKVGLVLHNDDTTAGTFSPMLLFTKRELPTSPYKATMAGMWARSPTGNGTGTSWIDGELHLGTAGNGSNGVKSRMKIAASGAVSMPFQPSANVFANAGNAGAYNNNSTNSYVIATGIRHNVGGHYDTSNGRFTCPVAGRYYVSFSGNWYNTGGATWLRPQIRKNGTTQTQHYENTSMAWHHLAASTILNCAVGDYLQIYNNTQNNAGGGMDVGAYSQITFHLMA